MGFRLRECELVYRRRAVVVPVRRIQSSEDVYRVVPDLIDRAHESLVVLLLDARQQVVAMHEAARGNASACAVDATTVYRAAVVSGAERLVLVHNHPSGLCEPSAEDLALTRRLVEAGKLLGVQVLDHVIVAADGYFSMLDAGLMPKESLS